MKIRKDVLFAVLATFCLCALMFAVVPIRSAGQPYNPWADINDDGKINMVDIGNVASEFMTSGDPTKNVTIAGHTNNLAYTVVFPVSAGSGIYSGWITVDGYSKVSVCVQTTAVDNLYMLTARHDDAGTIFTVDSQSNFPVNYVKTYDVPNRQITVHCQNHDAVLRTVSIDVYLIC